MIAEAPTYLDQITRREILATEIDSVVAALDHCFTAIVARVEGALFEEAEASSDGRKRQLLLDAYNALHSRRVVLEARFMAAFRQLMDECMRGDTARRGRDADELDWTEISLVDTAKVEADVQMMRLTDCIKSNVEWELRDLNARMSFLLDRDESDESANPLRPELFSRALSQACDELESDHQGRMAVMRAFEAALSEGVGAVYHDVNERLISRRVLPKIRHRSRAPRRGTSSRGSDGEGPHMQTSSGLDAHVTRIDSAMESVVESTLGMFDALQQLVGQTPGFRHPDRTAETHASHAAASASTSQWTRRSQSHTTTSLSGMTESVFGHALSAQASRRGLLAAIAELREAHALALDLAANPAAIDLLIDAPGEAAPTNPETRPLAAPNVIRMHRERLSAAAGTPVDRMKIDIVAMLFDHIFADEKLPAEIRMLLARLQLPVLRTALADTSFFASRAHPARRLIDRLASCAIGWRGQGAIDPGFAAEIERIVRAIADDSSDDAAVYERLLGEFECFLDSAREETGDIVCRAADVLERVEEREVLSINATIQINQLLYGVDVDPFLRAFLLDVWSHVLVETACRAKEPKTDLVVARAKRLCIDLVWSTAPKTNPNDRRRLVELLPRLIATLREGLALIGYPSEQETRFFSELMKLHSEAVRSVGKIETAAGDAAAGIDPLDIDQFAARLADMIVEHDFNALADVNVRASSASASSSASARRMIAASDVSIELITAARPTQGADSRADAEAYAAEMRFVESARIDDATLSERIAALEKGNWLELKTSGELAADKTSGANAANRYARVRLAWISPMKSFYLFVGTDGQRAQSLNPDALHALFRSGQMRFVEQERLVDRAVRSMMEDLEHERHAA